MKQLFLYILGCIMIHTSLQAQQLKGVIVNEKGNPIANSTVYIMEAAKGIAADNRGEFQAMLTPGNYTCEFRSLGYESIQKSISIGEHDQSVRVVLRESTFMLDELVVYASDEDPDRKSTRLNSSHVRISYA